jgi:hypothetical protein
MAQDVTLIATRLAPLAETGKTVSSLETLVKEKPIPRKPMGQAVAGFLKRGSKDVPKADGANAVDGEEQEQEEEGEEDEEGEELGVLADQGDETANKDDNAVGGGDKVDAKQEVSAPSPAVPERIASPAIPERITSPSAPDRITSPSAPNRITSPSAPGRITSPIPAIRSSIERLRSPSPAPQSPLTDRVASPISSPPPATPSAGQHAPNSANVGSPTNSRATRVSLANRLRGVMSRAGSAEPRDEVRSPPPPPKDEDGENGRVSGEMQARPPEAAAQDIGGERKAEEVISEGGGAERGADAGGQKVGEGELAALKPLAIETTKEEELPMSPAAPTPPAKDLPSYDILRQENGLTATIDAQVAGQGKDPLGIGNGGGAEKPERAGDKVEMTDTGAAEHPAAVDG